MPTEILQDHSAVDVSQCNPLYHGTSLSLPLPPPSISVLYNPPCRQYCYTALSGLQFYASWCAYSDAAMPEFKAVLQYIVDQNITDVHMGKIEVTRNTGRLSMHTHLSLRQCLLDYVMHIGPTSSCLTHKQLVL